MVATDSDLALHCLEDLGGRTCPIVKQRADALKPDVCDGLSIRDTLFSFLVQAIKQEKKAKKKGKQMKAANLSGQISALAYAIALIDNPYRVNPEGVMIAAETDARG